MIKSWMVIGGVAIALGALGGAIMPPGGRKWFLRLRRPRWLTFEAAIPFIWTAIFICGAWSAYIVWESDPGSSQTWLLMGGYLLLELITLSYMQVMLWVRSLRVGTLIGASGFILSVILAVLVAAINPWATVLLLPYVFWSPLGTYITWKMEQLNPTEV